MEWTASRDPEVWNFRDLRVLHNLQCNCIEFNAHINELSNFNAQNKS